MEDRDQMTASSLTRRLLDSRCMTVRRASIVYLSLAFTFSFYHFQTINRPFWPERSEFHQGIIRGDFKSPYQYRILAPWLVEIPSVIVERVAGIPPGKPAAMVREFFYLTERVLAVFLLFVVFHLYMETWFSSDIAFGGTVLFAALQVFTYFSYFYQPSSPINLLLLTAGAWLMARGEFKGWLYPLTVVGSLTRETFGLIVPLHIAFFGVKGRTLKHTIGLFLVWAAVQAALRGIFGFRPSFPLSPLDTGLSDASWPVALFALMWFIPLVGIKRIPTELRWMLLMFGVPLITANVLFGKVEETRLFLDLGIVLIPATLFVLLSDRNAAQTSEAAA